MEKGMIDDNWRKKKIVLTKNLDLGKKILWY